MIQPKAYISQVGVMAFWVIFFPLLAPSQAVTIRSDTPMQEYLDLGTQYSSVGQIKTSANQYGSGVLISSHWVLTAAHLTNNKSTLNFTLAGTTFTAASRTIHPSWNGDLLKGNDLALLYFNQDLSNLASPAPIYTGTDIVGQVGTYVGYGVTGTGLTGGGSRIDGKKRAAQNTIDGFFSPSVFWSDFDHPQLSVALPLEGLIALGDSGGGVFVNNYLVGINSFIQSFGNLTADYGDRSGHTLLSSHINWINSVIFPDQSQLITTAFSLVNNTDSITPPLDSNQATPEPLTILGAMTAVGFGTIFKQKRR